MAQTAAPRPDDGLGSSWRERLAAVLPQGHQFGIHHLSTPPTRTDALHSPPPGERPDRTYCEQHFLAVSIDAAESPRLESQQVLVLGIEIFLYTTAHATTLFVSKADSTGYLHRLGLPPGRGTPSPIRQVCATFIRYLVDERRRRDAQFVVSLFARAQDQYLFPGSVECGGKHVLDDRGLIRWWCRVLDPLIEAPPEGAGRGLPAWKNAEGFLVVPGLDAYETRALIPRRDGAARAWAVQRDPLERVSHYRREFDWVPPRCLIPRFPDDPKSRFRDELDDEADGTGGMRKTGSWKTVKTLEMFWEMMAFRQECSSGRMTGFLWVVFDDDLEQRTSTNDEKNGAEGREGEREKSEKENAPVAAPETPKSQTRPSTNITPTPTTTPRRLHPRKDSDEARAGKPRREAESRKPFRSKFHGNGEHRRRRRRTKLRGVIVPRQPRIKTRQRNYLLDRPISTAYYYWPAPGRGDKIVAEADYKRMLELLLHLDFSTLEKAVSSTRRWVSEVGQGGRWGYDVTGTRELGGDSTTGPGAAVVNNLSGLVKRKRSETLGETEMVDRGGKVNVLGGGLVRRKPKRA